MLLEGQKSAPSHLEVSKVELGRQQEKNDPDRETVREKEMQLVVCDRERESNRWQEGENKTKRDLRERKREREVKIER